MSRTPYSEAKHLEALARRARIMQMHAEGKSASDIAAAERIVRSTVVEYIRLSKLPAGVPPVALSDRLGAYRGRVKRARELCDLGLSASAIAATMHVTATSIRTYLQDHAPAQQKPAAADAPRVAACSDGATMRLCLTCRQQFLSQWKGNRVCVLCKKTVAWESAGADHSVLGSRR